MIADSDHHLTGWLSGFPGSHLFLLGEPGQGQKRTRRRFEAWFAEKGEFLRKWMHADAGRMRVPEQGLVVGEGGPADCINSREGRVLQDETVGQTVAALEGTVVAKPKSGRYGLEPQKTRFRPLQSLVWQISENIGGTDTVFALLGVSEGTFPRSEAIIRLFDAAHYPTALSRQPFSAHIILETSLCRRVDYVPYRKPLDAALR